MIEINTMDTKGDGECHVAACLDVSFDVHHPTYTKAISKVEIAREQSPRKLARGYQSQRKRIQVSPLNHRL